MRRLIILFALGAVACAPRVVWELPGQDSAAAEQQRQIDTAECTDIAMQEIILPAEPVRTKFDVNLQGDSQSRAAGSAQTTVTADELEAHRLRTAALAEAATERQAISDACMLRRGWVKRAG